MDQGLKQRLVGALVLISLAVIFLPLLFDGRETLVDDAESNIPEEPVIKFATIEPKNSEALDSAAKRIEESRIKAEYPELEKLTVDEVGGLESAEPKEEVKPDPSVTAELEAESPNKSSETSRAQLAEQLVEQEKLNNEAITKTPRDEPTLLTKAWTVQLAAFSSEQNANRLHARLLEAGYKAYVEKGISNQGQLFRVFVGPEIREERAKLQRDALQKSFKLKGIVVRYAP